RGGRDLPRQGIAPSQLPLDPGGSYRDVGNVPTFEFVPAVTTLPHYSSRHGVRIKDLEIIHEKAATLNMIMDEFTYENLKLVLMGVDTGGLAAARQREGVNV